MSSQQSRPLQSLPTTTPWLRQVWALIEERVFDAQLSVRWLAQKCHLSERHFSRKVKNLTGLPPSTLVLEVKLLTARKMLSETEGIKVKEVASRLHFYDTKYFSRRFKKRFDKYPSDYQNPLI